jgi:hypothetical protein
MDRLSENIEKLIATFNAKSGASVSAGEASAEKRGPGRPPKVSTPTVDQVRAAAQKLKDERGMPAVRKLYGEHGAEKAADMDPAKYASFIAAVDVLLKQKPDAQSDLEDDEI